MITFLDIFLKKLTQQKTKGALILSLEEYINMDS
jgi:hypothetical protein